MPTPDTKPEGSNLAFRKQVVATVMERLLAERLLPKSMLLSLIYVSLACIDDAKRPIRADVGEMVCLFLDRITQGERPVLPSKDAPFGSSWAQRADWYRQGLGYVNPDCISRDLNISKDVIRSMLSYMLDKRRDEIAKLATKLCNFCLACSEDSATGDPTEFDESGDMSNKWHFSTGHVLLRVVRDRASTEVLLAIRVDRRMLSIKDRHVFAAFAHVMNEQNVQSLSDLTRTVTGGHTDSEQIFSDLRKVYAMFRDSTFASDCRSGFTSLAGDF